MIASAKEIDALNITLFSCINSTNVHLCNYCTKIFVIVVNTCVCRRSVDNKAVILSYPILFDRWATVSSHRIKFMISRTSSSIFIFNEVPLLLSLLSLQVLKNYFPRISRILLLCFENCWHKFPTIKSPLDFEDENFPAIISSTKEAFDYIYLFNYLFINTLLLLKPFNTHGFIFGILWYDEVRRRIQPDWTQRNLPDHFGPRSWSSGRAQGSKSSSFWFPFHPAFSPASARYPLFSFCEKSFLEVKNVCNKSKSLKNDQREYGTYFMVMSVAICHFHVSMFGWNSREVRHDANDEIWKILRI